MANAKLFWTDDDWQTKNEIATINTGIDVFIADIPTKNLKTDIIEFTFFWSDANTWENKNFSVKIV